MLIIYLFRLRFPSDFSQFLFPTSGKLICYIRVGGGSHVVAGTGAGSRAYDVLPHMRRYAGSHCRVRMLSGHPQPPGQRLRCRQTSLPPNGLKDGVEHDPMATGAERGGPARGTPPLGRVSQHATEGLSRTQDGLHPGCDPPGEATFVWVNIMINGRAVEMVAIRLRSEI